MQRHFLLLALVLVAGSLFAIETGDTVAVSVREAEVRSAAGFLSPVQSLLEYGTSANVLSVRGDWIQIEAGSTRGWLHSVSVLPPQEMNLSGEAIGQGASTREIALAGRGFNEQVEREYQEQQDLDFGPVDDMETLVLPLGELGAFLEEIDAELDGGNS